MWLLAAVLVFCLLYNNVFILVRPEALYVPLNLAAAAVLVGAARRAGLSWSDLGLHPSSLGSGLRWGGSIATVIALGLGVALVLPFTDRFLDDARVAGMAGAGIAYQALVRIPIGTALFEEVVFRGVLFGAWSRVGTVGTAVVGSSIVFGLWHITPSIDMWRINQMSGPPLLLALFVLGAVVATGLGGVVLAWFRLRTDGIWAPVIVHAAANSLAALAAFASQRT